MALSDGALLTWEFVMESLGLDSAEQTMGEFYIEAATNQAEKYCRRKLKARDYTVQIDGNGSGLIVFPTYPINSITGIYVDEDRDFGASTEVTDYYADLDRGRIFHDDFDTEEQGAIKVVCNAGYSTVPQDLQMAALEIVAQAYRKISGSQVGLKSITGPEGLATSYEITIPMSAQMVLNAYKGVNL